MASLHRNLEHVHAALRDAVLGNVVLHAHGPGYYSVEPNRYDAGSSFRSAPSPPPPPPFLRTSQLSSTAITCQSTGDLASEPALGPLDRDLVDSPPNPSDSEFAVRNPRERLTRVQPSVGLEPSVKHTKHTRKRRVRVKSALCREQCRTSQARYRLKQRAYVSELETSVARLLHEIPLLEAQRHRFRFDSQQRAQETVSEYFQHFRHGIREAGDSQRSASVNQMLQVSGTSQQLMFLRSTMPDVTEALMEEWRRVSAQYKDLHFQLEHMEKTSDCLIAATARLSVTVTTTTLERVFPHLVESEAGEDLTLAVRLLGHRLAYPCLVLFEWDEATNLIVRLETDVDWVTPLLQLLGSLKDVVHVLKSRVPTPDKDGGELEGHGAQTSSLLGSFSS